VLFPAATLEEAMPYLEELRASVASYRMAVRGDNRPKAKEQGEKLRVQAAASGRGADPEDSQPPDKILSVTISIGAASPGNEAKTPAQVLKAADEALYRAKRGGRNRVSK